MTTRRLTSSACALTACLAAAIAADRREIKPGPTTISPAEAAIAADPVHGIEHAVILVDETLRDEHGNSYRITRHRRAKILDNEGRDLGDLKLPFDPRVTRLAEFWARTILPDGRVLELTKKELREQSLIKTALYEYSALAGAMPGIVPGAVIDYGYVFKSSRGVPPSIAHVQEKYPIRDYYYVWLPARNTHGWALTAADKLPLKLEDDGKRIVVTGKDVPPAPNEPLMPPVDDAIASINAYYSFASIASADSYWAILGEAGWSEIDGLVGDKASYKAVVDRIPIPPGAGFEMKLRTAYDWLQNEVQCTDHALRTDVDDVDDKFEPKPKESLIDALLRRGRGNSFDMTVAFLGIARELGAEVNPVLAPDRRYRYWNRSVLDLQQLRTLLVALREPGDTAVPKLYVAPGSGLPFGDLPWWSSGGVQGLMLRNFGGLAVTIGFVPPARNVTTSTASLTFQPEGEDLAVTWSRRYRGQSGHEDWLDLRARTPEERRKALEGRCGSGATMEVTKADAPGLGEPQANLRLECAGRLQHPAVDEVANEHRVRFDGPWIPAVPHLSGGTRLLPVVFPFVFTDDVTVDVGSPPGFEPAAAPAPVVLDRPFGTYRLRIGAKDGAYRVERTFVIHRIRVDTGEYPDLVTFLDGVRRADATTLVFRRTGHE